MSATTSADSKIRAAFEEVFICMGSNGRAGHLHIPDEDGERPLCYHKHGPGIRFQKKPIAVYPAGFMPWCSYCTDEWGDR